MSRFGQVMGKIGNFFKDFLGNEEDYQDSNVSDGKVINIYSDDKVKEAFNAANGVIDRWLEQGDSYHRTKHSKPFNTQIAGSPNVNKYDRNYSNCKEREAENEQEQRCE